MKRVLALLFIGLVAWAGAQSDPVIDDDVIDTDGIPDFSPDTTGTADGGEDIYYFEDGANVDVDNTDLLMSMGVDDTVSWDDPIVTSDYNPRPNLKGLADIGFAISVADIVAAIKRGGANPVEKLIIAKVLEFFNKAGIAVKGGALVWSMNKGPNIALASGCKADVHLESGWGAQATLKPATSLSVKLGFNDSSLVIKTDLHADTNFGMSGHIKARIGKKIFGKCIRISKGVGVKVGGDLVLNVDTQLAIKPTLTQINGQWVIKFQPTIWVGGKLIKFVPHASASFKIFGIHIRFIESKIKDAITKELSKRITPGSVQAELAKLQAALQAELTRIFANAVIPLTGGTLDADTKTKVSAACDNIKAKQFK